MALLAEAIVEEWLNRQGYFTIRGVKIGVDELDILAIRPSKSGIECRHIEVQASMRPVSCISKVPKKVQKETGKKPNSASRTVDELAQGVKEWVDRKYNHPKKLRLMQDLAPGKWTRELVVHKVKMKEELDLIEKQGVVLHLLSGIVRELRLSKPVISYASASDLIDLIHLGGDI